MSQNKIKIINGKLITPGAILDNGVVLVEDGIITSVGQDDQLAKGAKIIDAEGRYVSPGFIDIHVHGGGGFDFMDGHESAFLAIADLHARYGTTSMLPTTLTASKEELLHTLDVYERTLPKNLSGSQFLGMHLEGPYLAMSQRGAQEPRFIRDPDPKEYNKVLEKAHLIKRWSAAPELPGALEFAHAVRAKGILVSMAHTDALFEEAVRGFEHGFTLATHFYSAMSTVIRRNCFRYAGAVEAGYLIDDMDVEIIADGRHLPPPLLQLVYKIKGPGRTALITDAMRAAGMPEGRSILGSTRHGMEVIVEDGVAKLPDRTAFAGSVATADRLVRTIVKEAHIPLLDAIRMISATPAAILGLSASKGSLEAGKDADIVIFDEDIRVHSTIIKGELIYEHG
jgi:N-acetylglucosamine-6-phosphate deacetylase